ncbi:hypothetical protein [Shimazuella kribbensis]|uniref:hypothetical protein n=1 Tax=Shimazuella kribbensis TaxID=139808 RepID=UPI0004051574|nr:hypothetical protein [Shimazuella kribbensis]
MQLIDCLQQLYNELQDVTIQYKPNKIPKNDNEVFFGNELFSYYQNKLICHFQNDGFESTTEMLYHLEELHLLHNKPFQEYSFFFEDLSLDACLTFIMFYCRHHGVDRKDFPFEWIDYTIRWELDDVKTTGKPFESWGCLHSALAHSFFLLEEQISEDGKMFTIIDESHVTEGLQACIYLAISLMMDQVLPYEIPNSNHIEEYNRALLYLKKEYQKYELSIKQATITQLELPIKNSTKTILVDAFITTENTYIGLLKSFLIHDKERTWLESGFQFFAIYRPELNGTGRDIVIQVAQGQNVHLKDLWIKLEALENKRWGGTRPVDCKWHDQNGKFQTITAPKCKQHVKEHTKVKWSDVVDIIWELYNPAKTIMVNPFLSDGTIGASCRIYECKPIWSKEKHLSAAKWNSLGQQQVLVTSPTMQRYLANCASQFQDGVIPPIYPLPPESSFDFLETPFGYAIVHEHGVFLLDDWNTEPLDLTIYQKEVQNVVEQVELFQMVHEDCTQMMSKVLQWLAHKQTLSNRKLLEINHWISSNKIKIRYTILTTMFSSSDYHLQLFRETLEKRWTLQSRLQELYESISELEQIFENHTNLKTNRLVVLITIFGFPAVLFSGLLELIFENVPSYKWLGVHWTGLLLFIVFSLLGMGALISYLKFSPDPNKKREKNKSFFF